MKNEELEARLSRINAPIHQRMAAFFKERTEPKAVYGLLSEFLLVEGKRTLITMWALQMLPGKKRTRLAVLLRKENKSDTDVSETIGLFIDSGAPARAMEAARKMVDESIAELQAFPESEARLVLSQLADYITKRER